MASSTGAYIVNFNSPWYGGVFHMSSLRDGLNVMRSRRCEIMVECG